MTRIPTPIKVNCVSCRTAVRLTQEQYHELLKRSRVALTCPHCGHGFDYNLLTASSTAEPEPSPRPRRTQPEAPSPSARARSSAERSPPAEDTPVSAPDFPPPPFAPLGVGKPAPFQVEPPPFEPINGATPAPKPAAPFPSGSPTPFGEDAKKLTLNDRWKKLPLWVQWTVIGVMIVVLGVIIFAMPTGGGNAPAEPETSRSHKQSHEKSKKKASAKAARETGEDADTPQEDEERQP